MSTRLNPVRPVDRQKMSPWLLDLLDQESVSGLEWVDRSKKTFRISWIHGSRQTYNQEEDAKLFKLYAKHTGRYDEENLDHKAWKTNFRAALRSLKDVKYHRSQSRPTGDNAFRLYQFIDTPSNDARRVNDPHDSDEAVSSPSSSSDDYNIASPTSFEASEVRIFPGDEPILLESQQNSPPRPGNLPALASLLDDQDFSAQTSMGTEFQSTLPSPIFSQHNVMSENPQWMQSTCQYFDASQQVLNDTSQTSSAEQIPDEISIPLSVSQQLSDDTSQTSPAQQTLDGTTQLLCMSQQTLDDISNFHTVPYDTSFASIPSVVTELEDNI